MAEVLRQSDIFVFASLGEGLSLSTLETNACVLPLIATENFGVNDGMVGGQEDFIIPIQSKDAIKEKILWFVEHPNEISRMGLVAREFATKFSWEAYYKRMGDIFRSLDTNESSSVR